MGSRAVTPGRYQQAVKLLNAYSQVGKGSVNHLFNQIVRMYRCRLTATRL
jgi:hypothetical protein